MLIKGSWPSARSCCAGTEEVLSYDCAWYSAAALPVRQVVHNDAASYLVRTYSSNMLPSGSDVYRYTYVLVTVIQMHAIGEQRAATKRQCSVFAAIPSGDYIGSAVALQLLRVLHISGQHSLLTILSLQSRTCAYRNICLLGLTEAPCMLCQICLRTAAAVVVLTEITLDSELSRPVKHALVRCPVSAAGLSLMEGQLW